MTYASILAVVCGAPDDAEAVGLAADLAARQKATLRVLTAFPPADVGAWAYGIGTPALTAQLVQALDQSRRDLDQHTRALVAREADRFGLACEAGIGAKAMLAEAAPTTWLGLAQQLPLTDLMVIAHSSAKYDGPWTGILADAMMSARTPVLIARGDVPANSRPAAVAWDGSLEAGRALRASIPLLQDASEVAIIQDPDGLGSPGGSIAEPERLIEYLGHHGVGPISVVKLKGREEGRTLLHAASSFGAALLVAGAFGHSRVREALFGGATHSFLQSEDGPHLLLSH